MDRERRCGVRPFARPRPAHAAAVLLACALAPHSALAQAPLSGLRTDYVAGTSPYAIALADLDLTGRPDMAVANFASASISVFVDDGPGRFHPRHDLLVGAGPRAIATGDVNGDGIPDLVTANSGASTVSVVLGRRGGTFSTHADFATGSGPRALAIEDVNGDGMPDLAVAGYFAGTVSVLYNDGRGRFPTRADFSAGTGPSGIAVADLNGDGHPDLLVANSASNTVSVLLGDGHGGFARRTNYLTGASPVALAAADVNGDGRPDCVVANYGGNTVSVLLGNGSGGLTPKFDLVCNPGPTAVVIADADGDGNADVVTSNGKSDTVTLLTGNGAGGFASAVNFLTGQSPTGIAVGDLNGDGRPDLVTPNSAEHTVSVNYGTYAGALGAATTVATGASPRAIAVGDADADGVPDVIVTSYLANVVSVYHGDGAGGFASHADYPTGDGPLAVALADLDQDGFKDLVVANANAGSVSVFLADGLGSFRERVDYPVMSYPCAIAVGDVVGDSLLDLVVADQGSNLVSVLMGFGAGTFGARTDWITGSSPRAVAIGDMNSDGRKDILVTDFNGRSLSILLRTAAGDFAPRTTWGDPGLNPVGLAIVDVNGDHYPDAIMANFGSASVSVLLGNGASGYRLATDYPAGAGARAVSVVDVNDDGNLDLLVANETAGTISVLLGDGRGSFAAHADFPAGASPWEVAAVDPDGLPGGHREVVVTNHGDDRFSLLTPRQPTFNALIADPEPSVLGEPVTLTATVAPSTPGPGDPAGTVRFYQGTTPLGTAAVAGGVAALTSPPLPLGHGTLSARYSGDALHLPSLAPGIAHHAYRCGTALSASAQQDTAFEADQVVIDAAGFPRASLVRFGGIPSPSFTLTPISFAADSPSVRIVATVPLGALSGPVRIESPCGTAVSTGVIEVRKSFAFANARTGKFGWLLGLGWPVARSLADTLGVPLDALGLRGRSDTDWRVKSWDPLVQDYVTAGRLRIGQGYWIQTRDPWSVRMDGTVTRETTLVLPLPARGWHLFGNPFSQPIAVQDLRVLKRGVSRPLHSQTDVQPTVFVWDDGAARYVAGTTIAPGGLFWVRRLAPALVESLLVSPPSLAGPTAPAPPGAPLDWSARLWLREAGAGADTVLLGAAPLAAGAAHPLTAQAPPPSPAGNLSLSLEAPDDAGGLARYQAMIHARADAPAWTVLIEHASAPGEVQIGLASDGAPPGMALVLRDPLTGDVLPLESGRPVTLAAVAAARRLRLELVSAVSARRTPVLEQVRAYPNPFGAATGFWFSHAADADVRVALYDLAGRQVRVLERANAPAGENVLLWDGRDARGQLLPAAVYFARCEAGSLRRSLRVVRVR